MSLKPNRVPGFLVALASSILVAGFYAVPSLAQDCTPGADCARQLYQSRLDTYAAEVAKARQEQDKAKEITAIANAAEAHQYFGRFQKALEIYQQALTLARSSKNRLAEAELLGKMAVSHHKLLPSSGIDFLEQQLQQARDRNSQGIVLEQLGQHTIVLGNYQKAIDVYTRYLALLGNTTTPERASALGNLALAYSELGDLAGAIEIQKQTISLQRELHHPELNEHIKRLGELYIAQGKPAEAVELYNQLVVSALRQQNTFWAIDALQGMAVSYAALGNLPKTQELLKSAFNFTDNLDPTLRPTLQRDILDRLSLSYAWSGNYKTAIELQQRLGKGFRGDDRAFINSDLDDIFYEHLGAFYLRIGKYQEAEFALRKAIANYIRSRQSDDPNADNLIVNGDETTIGNYEMAADLYRHLQETLVKQNRIGEALEIAETGRARAFVGLLSKRLGVSPNAQPVVTPPNLAQIKQIAKAENSTLVIYSILHADLVSYTETRIFRLGSGKRKESGLLIWVVKPTGEVAFQAVDLSKQLTGQSLTDFVRISRDAIGLRGRGLAVISPTSGRDAKQPQTQKLQQLYQLLIQPIAEHLPTNPKDRITFIPQDALYLVPFAALQAADGKYLIQSHTILTAPSIQVLGLSHQVAERQGTSSTLTPALVVGNPTMPQIRVALNAPPEALPALPGAEREAKAIAQLLNTQPLIGAEATEAAVLAQISQAKVIHLATHGILENLEGLQSAIALAPSAKKMFPSAQADGFLTASQVLELKLNARLVVLSACDTGRGEITGDGVIGLSRSFISAGVPSVIVSLWSVPDAPTAALMREFYQKLKQDPDKASALRQAMLTTMQQYPDPKDWAAFTLVGEP